MQAQMAQNMSNHGWKGLTGGARTIIKWLRTCIITDGRASQEVPVLSGVGERGA